MIAVWPPALSRTELIKAQGLEGLAWLTLSPMEALNKDSHYLLTPWSLLAENRNSNVRVAEDVNFRNCTHLRTMRLNRLEASSSNQVQQQETAQAKRNKGRRNNKKEQKGQAFF